MIDWRTSMVGPPWFRRLREAWRWYWSGEMRVSMADVKLLTEEASRGWEDAERLDWLVESMRSVDRYHRFGYLDPTMDQVRAAIDRERLSSTVSGSRND